MDYRAKQLLGIAILGLALFLFLASSDSGLKSLVAIGAASAIIWIFRDEPRFRRAAEPSRWIERRKGRLALLGLFLIVASLVWMVTSIAWELEPLEAQFYPFLILFASGFLLLGVVFYTWLTRILLGKD